MVFSSIEFIFYFLPLVLILYYLTPKRWANGVLLIASLLFYAWGAPKFALIFIGSMLCNFFITQKMGNTTAAKPRKWLLALSVVLNVGLLVYFKYMNFFLDNVNVLLQTAGHAPIIFTRIALPIGISFFTFQSLSYSIDVFRGTVQPQRKCIDYMLYIAMFPQMIAGPIVRYNTIAAQLGERTITMEDRVMGFYRFVIGLAKKVLIANTVAQVADQIFAMDYSSLSTGTAWLGGLAYTFQIYFDFSGYSDMAIGLGRMLGFRFPENFNAPYISQSITEFWRRWHITLGGFMRDYLYIPLGGNRVSRRRLYFNLGVVFLISGIWHGASWNFLLWGVFHGLFLIMDRIFLLNVLKKIGKLPATLFTFLVVTVGFVCFRIEDVRQLGIYYRTMFAFQGGDTVTVTPHILCFFLIATFFSFAPYFRKGTQWMETLYAEHYSARAVWPMAAVILLLFVLSVGNLAVTGFNPFIYFRF